MLDKDSINGFLGMISQMSPEGIKRIFGKDGLTDLLFNIDIEREMNMLNDYLQKSNFTVGNAVATPTGETGAILSIDGDRCNVVMDGEYWNTLEEQVRTYNLKELTKIN
jgi:hypothetical protein